MRHKVIFAVLLFMCFKVSANEGTFILSVSNPAGAPGMIVLVPDGVEETKKNRIELEATVSAIETSLFVGKLAPGTYWVKRYKLKGEGNTFVDGYLPEIPLASVSNDRNRIVVRSGEVQDLGRWRLDTLGGSLGLVLPDDSAPSNSEVMPTAIQASVSAPEKVLPSARESELLTRSKLRGKLIQNPTEDANGQWTAISSNGRRLLRQSDGSWTSKMLTGNERVGVYSAEAKIVISEFGRFWSVENEAQPQLLAVPKLPGVPHSIACSLNKSCVVAIRKPDLLEVYSFSSPEGKRTLLLSIPWKFSTWVGAWPTFALLHDAKEAVVLHGKSEVTRVHFDDLITETNTLPFKIFMPSFIAGRVSIGERYSDDLGRTWKSVDKRMRDGIVQISQSGQAYVYSNEIGFSVATPIIRRSPDGVSQWVTVAKLPTAGDLVVGRYSKLMYLAGGTWKSTDGGMSWQPDLSLYEATIR